MEEANLFARSFCYGLICKFLFGVFLMIPYGRGIFFGSGFVLVGGNCQKSALKHERRPTAAALEQYISLNVGLGEYVGCFLHLFKGINLLKVVIYCPLCLWWHLVVSLMTMTTNMSSQIKQEGSDCSSLLFSWILLSRCEAKLTYIWVMYVTFWWFFFKIMITDGHFSVSVSCQD